MNFSAKDAYTVMLNGYPDIMDIDQMAQLLGISKKQVISSCKTERFFYENRTVLPHSQSSFAGLPEDRC